MKGETMSERAEQPRPECDSVLKGIKLMTALARTKCWHNMNDFDIVLGPHLYEQLRREVLAIGATELELDGTYIAVLTANGATKVFKRQEEPWPHQPIQPPQYQRREST